METSWRNTTSRHRDNVHVCDKRPVWGYLLVDQPTSTCFKWHTSITVYLQRTSGCSNSHERRCGTQNLWKGYESKSTLEMNVYEIFFSDFQCNKYFTLFCGVFVWKWGPGLEQAAVVTMATTVLPPLKRACLGIPPECLTACKIWRGVENFHFPRCLILADSFLTKPLHRGFVKFSNFVLFHNQSHGKDSLDWNLFKYIFFSVFKTLLLWSVFFNSRKMMWVDFIRHEKKINELKRWTDKWVVLRKQTTEIKRWLYSP